MLDTSSEHASNLFKADTINFLIFLRVSSSFFSFRSFDGYSYTFKTFSIRLIKEVN